MISQSTLRPANIKRHMKFPKLCSCCRESGHNITVCDDMRINSLESIHKTMVTTMSEVIYLRYVSYNETVVIQALCLRLKLVTTLSAILTRHTAIQYLLNNYISMRIIIEYPSLEFTPKLHNITFQYNNKKFNKKHLESCPVCYESGKNIIKYNCSHVICSTCLLSTITHTSILCCALCRANITHIYTQNKKILNEIKLL